MATCPTCKTTYPDTMRLCPTDGAVLEGAEGPKDDNIGRTLDGKYRLDKKLSSGGMGTVYKATHLMLGKSVAVKLIKADLPASPDVVRRFQREAKAASALNHPNIAPAYDLGQTQDGTLYIAMEYIDGPSLKEVIQSGPVPPARTINLLKQVASALSLAHKHEIIHRDLKPQNIMITKDAYGRDLAKLLDFGIAKTLDDSATQLTATGFSLGTPQYMSPEQAYGRPVDGRSDLYSLGIILYEMLVGEVPFSDPSTPAVLVKQMTEAPVPPELKRPDLQISPALAAVALKCLEKDPAKRYQTADEFSDALDAAAASVGASVTPLPVAAPNSGTVAPTVVIGAGSGATTQMPTPAPRSAPVLAAANQTTAVSATPVPAASAATTKVNTKPVEPVAAPAAAVAAAPAVAAAAVPPAAPAPVAAPAAAKPAVPAAKPSGGGGSRAAMAALVALVLLGGAGYAAYAMGLIKLGGAKPATADAAATPATQLASSGAPSTPAPAPAADSAAAPAAAPAATPDPNAAGAASAAGAPASGAPPSSGSTPPAGGGSSNPPSNGGGSSATPPPSSGSANATPSGSPSAITPPPSASGNSKSAPAHTTTTAAPASNPTATTPIKANGAPSAPAATSGGANGGSMGASSSPSSSGKSTGSAVVSKTPIQQAPAPVPAAAPAAAPARPANPSVAFRCDGAPDICGALRSAMDQALAKDSMSSVRDASKAEVSLEGTVTFVDEQKQQMFGQTFTIRNYTIEVSGDARRGGEAVPMPSAETLNYDARYRDRLDEKARVVAGNVVEKIREFWKRK